MTDKELNDRIILFLQSPENLQEFADIASIETNWKRIDKSIKIPSHIGVKEEDCPSCFEPIRLIYDKFLTANLKIGLICPHCKSDLKVRYEFLGYTNEIYLTEA
ncbi:MAG: hypothetical protein M5R37_10135 [Melioribacteraceae bacterium]|nr:hypothetical protein [Melioribacteraceae bacterium]